FLVIDGDHTREGVKRDFLGYRSMMRPGGLIVFDDYAVKEWPDIKAYFDDEVRTREDLKVLHTGFRTALVQAL
ncbi:MAG: class I SAM-dependent methyltransferase, partial [Pseudomonadota bacterium]